MKYTRIYADGNGESHFEDIEIGMKPAPANTGTISEMIATKGVMFRQSGEYFINWHNAPRRQFVVNLTGTVLLADDLTGKGHTSRGLGGEERISLFIPLAD